MEETKIHSGTRIKLKKIPEQGLPADFLSRLRDHAHKDERIQAIFVFAVQPEGQPEQPSIAIALKTGIFDKKEETFLAIVDEVQLLLPDDMAFNLYRFGASEFLAKYCAASVEPVFLRNASWLEKQRKKLA